MTRSIQRKLFVPLLVYFLIGSIYYYFNSAIPIEITLDWLLVVYLITVLISPILIGVIIGNLLPDHLQENRYLGCIIPAFVFGLFIHNTVLALITMIGKGYKDKDIYYPDPSNRNHKIIIQEVDRGALGHQTRQVEVIEITPFLRYIKNEEPFSQ